jgi:hypothetical protein
VLAQARISPVFVHLADPDQAAAEADIEAALVAAERR